MFLIKLSQSKLLVKHSFREQKLMKFLFIKMLHMKRGYIGYVPEEPTLLISPENSGM